MAATRFQDKCMHMYKPVVVDMTYEASWLRASGLNLGLLHLTPSHDTLDLRRALKRFELCKSFRRNRLHKIPLSLHDMSATIQYRDHQLVLETGDGQPFHGRHDRSTLQLEFSEPAD